jgi:hypothetical protein
VTEQPGFRRYHFLYSAINLPEQLTTAQLDGRACVHCGAEDQPMRPVEAWSELSSQLFECVDGEACADRRGICAACSHEWRWHTTGGMCQGTVKGIECHCVMMRVDDCPEVS